MVRSKDVPNPIVKKFNVGRQFPASVALAGMQKTDSYTEPNLKFVVILFLDVSNC
jgi:hypothetical protein